MTDQFTNEPMLDMYIFETSQMIEQLEKAILDSEKESHFTNDAINEIFRIMHTIKGSSAMMMFQNIATLAHSLEDIFYFLREEKPEVVDCSTLSDYIFEGVDFIKIELEKIKNGDEPDGEAETLIGQLGLFLTNLKTSAGLTDQSGKKSGKSGQKKNTEMNEPIKEPVKQQFYIRQEKTPEISYQYRYKAVIFFEEGSGMENIRAYTIIHNLADITDEYFHIPQNIIEDESSMEAVQKDGFTIFLKSDSNYEEMNQFFQQTIYLQSLELVPIDTEEEYEAVKNDILGIPEQDLVITSENSVVVPDSPVKMPELLIESVKVESKNDEPKQEESKKEIILESAKDKNNHNSNVQSIISVSVTKLDKLMDLVGEMVISEAMVTQNPDLAGLELDNFQKAAQQLNKITSELQDTVMSIRMVPLSPTFQKMNRIVRDMCKHLSKEVDLHIIGEETEVDKNIIEHISDPLMHLVRNSIDHGIEPAKERIEKGKDRSGCVTLEAKNSGSDVLIIVRDDGKGLDKNKILQKASENGLLYKKPEDMTDKEIFNLIFLPGFSTKDNVSEFSGRGVGMDVVCRNIEEIGGTLSVDSEKDKGCVITLKIPLTLAIIDGMNLKVGNSCYTLPIVSIKESLRPAARDIITDPDGNEMLMIRGECYPIIRLHEKFAVENKVMKLTEGIVIVVEQDGRTIVVFADELVGQQQVVVKGMPPYIQKIRKIRGIGGCTLLGDGSISLILDVAGLISMA